MVYLPSSTPIATGYGLVKLGVVVIRDDLGRRGRLVLSARAAAYTPATCHAALTATAWIRTATFCTLTFLVLEYGGRSEELINAIHGALDDLELVVLLLSTRFV